jgi:hypothetical protein
MPDQGTSSGTPAPRRRRDARSPAERSLQARMAAHVMNARHDPRVTTVPGRAAFLARFEREVDPEGRLHPEERRRRAAHARRAYFLALSLKSAQARRKQRARHHRRRDGDAA